MTVGFHFREPFDTGVKAAQVDPGERYLQPPWRSRSAKA
jgi:hypothetical protein